MFSATIRSAGLGARIASQLRSQVPAMIRNMSAAATQKSDVIFSKTSSPELDDTLTTILHRIVLPYRLPAPQRKMVFSEDYRSRLQTDPIVIEVDGYEHRFETLNFKKKDMPNSRAILLKALRLMKTPADWENLVRLLNGYARSKRTIKLHDRFRIIREAGCTGNIWAIIDAMRQSEKSGLYLRHLPPVDEMMYWLCDKAIKSSWNAHETKQAATWATIVMDILEEPEHRRQKKTFAPRELHREPQVLAQYLLLLAARSVFHGDKLDVDGQVTKVAQLLALEWPAGKGLLDLHPIPKEEPSRDSKMLRAKVDYVEDFYLHYSATRHISIAATTLKAIELAKQIVNPELAAKLDAIAVCVNKEMEERLSKRTENVDKRGWERYDELLGPNQAKFVPVEKEAPAPEAEAAVEAEVVEDGVKA
ncbi:hypothetical protein BROUX41_003953 [Berkeleyomyces rouxiae]|uniref:uncharacterized protein n=1 Tax=Berkeleyomyces rouxiae TaxID=2035830 RepID=UPI003B7CEFDF